MKIHRHNLCSRVLYKTTNLFVNIPAYSLNIYNTHYNVYGATTVAKLLSDALFTEVPALAEYKKK